MQETKYANARSVMEMVKLGAFATEIGAAAKEQGKGVGAKIEVRQHIP